MKRIINHDLRVVNGGTIYMPKYSEGQDKWGNMAFPNVYELGVAAGWPKGTIFREGFKTFVYTYRHAAYANPGSANGLSPPGGFVESGAIRRVKDAAGIAGVAGAYTIQLNWGGALAKDVYAGGEICNLDGTAPQWCQSRYIIGNTVQEDVTNYVTFTVDGPNLRAVNVLDYYTIVEGVYDSCRLTSAYDIDGVNDYSPAIGCVMVNEVLERYEWLQTGGPNASIRVINSWEGDLPQSFAVYYLLGLTNRSEWNANSSTPLVWGRAASALQRVGYIMGTGQSNGFETVPVADTVSQSVWLSIFN